MIVMAFLDDPRVPVLETLLTVVNIKDKLHKIEDNPITMCYHIIDANIARVFSCVC